MADPRESWHIITSKFPPQRGGIGFHSAHIAKGLEKKGYDVHIWTSVMETEGPGKEKPANVTESSISEIDDTERYKVNRIATVWNASTFEAIAQEIAKIGGELREYIIQVSPRPPPPILLWVFCRLSAVSGPTLVFYLRVL